MITTATPDFLTSEPEDRYHLRAAEFLSSHQLADFRKCPQLYHKRKLGLIPDVDRPAYVLGRPSPPLRWCTDPSFAEAIRSGVPRALRKHQSPAPGPWHPAAISAGPATAD